MCHRASPHIWTLSYMLYLNFKFRPNIDKQDAHSGTASGSLGPLTVLPLRSTWTSLSLSQPRALDFEACCHCIFFHLKKGLLWRLKLLFRFEVSVSHTTTRELGSWTCFCFGTCSLFWLHASGCSRFSINLFWCVVANLLLVPTLPEPFSYTMILCRAWADTYISKKPAPLSWK